MAIRAFIRPQSGGFGWGLRVRAHGLDRIRRAYPMALQGVSLSIEPIESRLKPLLVSGPRQGRQSSSALGKPKKFGRRDFSRRPMTWLCSTDGRAIRILGYLAGQGTPTFLWSATE